jgi:protein subunit release factor A
VVKKARDTTVIEAEITKLEKRIAELSNDMTKPEIAREITRLVAVNDEYERCQAQLATLMDEWERAEAAAASGPKKTLRRR